MNKSAKSLPLLGGKPRHENWSRLTFDVRTNRPQFSQNLFIFCSFVHPLLSVLSFPHYQVVFGKCFPWPRNSVLVPRHFFSLPCICTFSSLRLQTIKMLACVSPFISQHSLKEAICQQSDLKIHLSTMKELYYLGRRSKKKKKGFLSIKVITFNNDNEERT